jgi:hypothetical protein
MRWTLAWVPVALVLIAGCGGGSESSNGGGDDVGPSNPQSPGDSQYLDPFQRCLSPRQVREQVFRVVARAQSPKRQRREIRAVRDRAC